MITLVHRIQLNHSLIEAIPKHNLPFSTQHPRLPQQFGIHTLLTQALFISLEDQPVQIEQHDHTFAMEFPPFYWSVLLIAVPALFWLLSRRSRRPTQMQIRLRNLPRNTDRSLVLQILQAFATRNPRIVSSTDIDSAELIVQSLTPSIDEKQSIATIQVICSGQAWPRSGKIMFKEHQVEFDADFADLTPLYWADEWMVE